MGHLNPLTGAILLARHYSSFFQILSLHCPDLTHPQTFCCLPPVPKLLSIPGKACEAWTEARCVCSTARWWLEPPRAGSLLWPAQSCYESPPQPPPPPASECRADCPSLCPWPLFTRTPGLLTRGPLFLFSWVIFLSAIFSDPFSSSCPGWEGTLPVFKTSLSHVS